MDLCLQVSDIMCQNNIGSIFMTSGRSVAGFWYIWNHLRGIKDPVLLFWWNEREIRESVPWSLKISVLMDYIL